MVKSAEHYRADALLQDGASIHIRALRKDDKQRLLDHFNRLSQRSVYFRFFRSRKWLPEAELAQFTDLDFTKNVALVAVRREGDEERIMGVGRYSLVDNPPGPPKRAEVAFAVADEHQGKGIGTLLLEHLVSIALASDISEFEAHVLGENNQMLKLLADSGFKVARSLEEGVIHASFPTEETEEFLEAHQARERHAAAQSVRAFLEPHSVAVVGASRQAGSIGAALVTILKQCDFKGKIYPVNPKAPAICDLPASPSVCAIGAPVDMALIAVPAPLVEAALLDCARSGVRGVVVISAGFGEVSSEGREMEKRLRQIARSSGMRMVGPNCMGILNTDPRISLNATFVPTWPPDGNIGLLSQSGALGYVILDRIQASKTGISTFVSVGNKADVSGNDLLAYWAEDPRTRVIALYLESLDNPRQFARLASEVARNKPIVAIKAARSAAGTRAASSHTAALADADVAVDALFEQAGVIRTNTLEELMDVATLFSTQPVPIGPRVGAITNGGGAGILLADACEAHGLKLPELTSQTLERLRSFLPAQAALTNPVDTIASATPKQYFQAIEAVGSDPNINSLIIIYIPPQLHSAAEMFEALAKAAARVPLEKPVLCVFMSSQPAPLLLSPPPRGRIPVFGFPENAALALSAAERYERWRKRPRGSILSLDPFARATVRAVIDRILASSRTPVWLDQADAFTVLHAAGIEMAAAELATPDKAEATAERMGYPLVAKVVSAGLIHKSDLGGVLLGLRCKEDVASAVATFVRRMQRSSIQIEKILLQREVPGGIEALVGVTSDPTFGPLVGCGLGGVMAELLKDISFRLSPVSDVDAAEMIEELRAHRILDGYRGMPAGDRAALIRVVQQVSSLVELIPELQELDLNPVKVLEPGRGAIVVDGRIKIGPVFPRVG
jgi:acetyl coenzyme A synthetase (ADP forming)-like protein